MIKQNIFSNVPQKIEVLGSPISVVTMKSALDCLADGFEAYKGKYICAANVHTTVMAYECPEYQQVQRGAIMVLPDGKPLSVIGRYQSRSVIEKVTGTHFMQEIFEDERFRGKRHYFYGNTADVIELMLQRLKYQYPELQIAGGEPSVFRELTNAEVEELVSRIVAVKADFVWVGIGAPKQEYLMERLKGKTESVMTGVGGAFNILAGLISDAPKWMQEIGLEWFYRFCHEPRRLFRRYLVTNSKFIYYLLKGKNNV